ncbi:MAG: 2OG-Fe(II) oxygenase [Gammaproteobacteria bacterium]|nr:2OG-Fe(II) oxygenase [Gammaproteobacteria bacterium]MDH5803122.1 2OG-Fe(II) oxygenase [Gammaproteobacteria bacterium]
MGITIENNIFNFRYTLGSFTKRAVCHVDDTQFSAVMYLTLPEHCQGGTSIFRHIPTNSYSASCEENLDFTTAESWEEIHRVEMRFNRMVVYPGQLFHSVTPPFFGDSIENARLSQTMFINPLK